MGHYSQSVSFFQLDTFSSSSVFTSPIIKSMSLTKLHYRNSIRSQLGRNLGSKWKFPPPTKCSGIHILNIFLSSYSLFYHVPIMVDFVMETASTLPTTTTVFFSLYTDSDCSQQHQHLAPYANAKCEIPQHTVETSHRSLGSHLLSSPSHSPQPISPWPLLWPKHSYFQRCVRLWDASAILWGCSTSRH